MLSERFCPELRIIATVRATTVIRLSMVRTAHSGTRTSCRFQREADDADYEGDDRLVYESAFDNLHCARHLYPSKPGFSSLGCQVVAGIPGGKTSRPGGEKGPWKAFVDAAYELEQTRFRYALFDEGETLRTVELGADRRTPTVRFGSTGDLAAHVQEGLIAAGHYVGEARVDGVVGFETLLAIRDVQLKAFGPTAVDLVVGPMTAKELGISWPSGSAATATGTALPKI